MRLTRHFPYGLAPATIIDCSTESAAMLLPPGALSSPLSASSPEPTASRRKGTPGADGLRDRTRVGLLPPRCVDNSEPLSVMDLSRVGSALSDAVESGELKTGYQFINGVLVNIRE